MNIIKKFAIGAAILGAATVANAENLIFGAYVEPIIMLETEGRIVPADALLTGLDNTAYTAATKDDITVGAFRVTTNLVKWNMKIVALNKGNLLSRFGALPLTTRMSATGTGGSTDGALGSDAEKGIFLCPTYVNREAVAAECEIADSESKVGDKPVFASGVLTYTNIGLVGEAIDLTIQNKLSQINATPAFANDFYNEEKNSMTFEIRTGLPGDEVTALAGTYTETLYMAVYGSY